MVDMSAIAGALGALKAANDIAQAMVGLRDTASFQAKLIEFQAKIIEANNSAFAAQDERTALLRRISDLESEVATLKAERSRLQRYELKDFGGNTFAYQLKQSEANGEPIHRACPTCYQKGQISILQFSHHESGQDWYDCLVCNSHRPFGQAVRRDLNRDRGGEYF
jgi:formate dehydrogenase maturation protein FdhE